MEKRKKHHTVVRQKLAQNVVAAVVPSKSPGRTVGINLTIGIDVSQQIVTRDFERRLRNGAFDTQRHQRATGRRKWCWKNEEI